MCVQVPQLNARYTQLRLLLGPFMFKGILERGDYLLFLIRFDR